MTQYPPRQQKPLKSNPGASEHDIQVALVQVCRLHESKYPELKLLYAVPNGGYRTPATARWLKAEGVRPGVPDLCLPVSRGGYGALYVEMKAGRNGLTDHQTEYTKRLADHGNKVVVAYSWEYAWKEILNYLNSKDK